MQAVSGVRCALAHRHGWKVRGAERFLNLKPPANPATTQSVARTKHVEGEADPSVKTKTVASPEPTLQEAAPTMNQNQVLGPGFWRSPRVTGIWTTGRGDNHRFVLELNPWRAVFRRDGGAYLMHVAGLLPPDETI